jgi:hypothetical protein
MKICSHCNGRGWKRTSDTSAAPCPYCLRPRMVRDFLGTELAMAEPSIKSSPLYAALGDVNEEPTLDRTTENLFIKSTWSALRVHLKLALGHRFWLNPSFHFRTETDERIFNVWIGKEKYEGRSRNVRDDVTTFNSLRDLTLEPDLFIVRLGHIAHPNKAAPGAFKEALQLREVALKPTWVVQESSEHPYSWSVDVAAYLSEHFDVVDLTHLPLGSSPQEQTVASSTVGTPHRTMDVEDHEPSPVTTMSTDLDDPMGLTRQGTYKPSRNGYKRRPSGGGEGPV